GGRRRRRVGRRRLHRRRPELGGALLALAARLALVPPDDQRGLALGLVLDLAAQLGPGLLTGQPGRPLQDEPPLLLHPEQLGPPVGQLDLGLGELAFALGLPPGLLVEPLLPLGQPLLPAFEVGAELLELRLQDAALLLDLLPHLRRALRRRLR